MKKIIKNLGENFENETLLDEIDSRLSKLGDFFWEIGPGATAANQLVISPGGAIDLLPITKEIVSYAKKIPNWEFHYAKPPKNWDLLFLFERSDGNVIRLDASNWKYVLLKYKDGFEVIIKTNDLDRLSEEDKFLAAEILLDGILGEEVRMVHIRYIEVVKEFDQQYLTKSSNMLSLFEHLKHSLSHP